MKPLNHSAQKSAIKKFIIAYAVSILLILGAAYYWFSSPSRIVKDELKKSQEFMAQHDSLVARTSNITAQINALRDFESKNGGPMVAATDNKIKDYLNDIHDAARNLSLDSGRMSYPLLTDNLKNFLVAYDALVNYGSEGRALKEKNGTLQSMLDAKGDNGQNSINALLTACMSDKEALRRQLEEAKNSKPIPVPAGGGGGGGAANAAELAKLKDDNARIVQERDQFKKDKAQLEEEVKQKDAQLKNAGNAGANVQPSGGGCTDADKANAMYKAADLLYSKGMAEKKDMKRGYLSGALDILKSATVQSYPDKDKLKSRINEINNILNPIGNN